MHLSHTNIAASFSAELHTLHGTPFSFSSHKALTYAVVIFAGVQVSKACEDEVVVVTGKCQMFPAEVLNDEAVWQ